MAHVEQEQRRGFSVMDPDKLRVVCARGGQTAHALGRAHRFSAEKASQAGKKGGATVSADRSHMAEIGSRGGKAKKGYRERQAVRCQAKAEQAPSA
ncbi:MAG: stress-induced protein [Myxococcales bacterium]|nr:stress-induced protein [Myxococcales bacterium]